MDWKILSNLIAALALIVISLQLWLLWRQIIADHERRKKQATVEFVHELRFQWIQLRTRRKKIISDPEEDSVVVSLLGSS